MRLKQGILIVFEGIDGSGKTTQALVLLDKLRSRSVEAAYFREPSDSRWGREIKRKASKTGSLKPEEELALFQKDRKSNVEKNLKPALDQRKAVILDRYYFSTMAYQGARGIDPEKIRRMNEAFASRPELVFILDVEAFCGLGRIKDRKDKDLLFEQEDYLVKVRELFRSFKGENIHHIPASGSIEEISTRIEKIVFDCIDALAVKE